MADSINQVWSLDFVSDALQDGRRFATLAEAREILEAWRVDYNSVRPHSSLGYQTPEEFAASRQVQAPGCARLVAVASPGACTSKTERVSV